MFIWKNNEIVGSMVISSQDKCTFEIVSKSKYEIFHSYDEAKEYLIKIIPRHLTRFLFYLYFSINNLYLYSMYSSLKIVGNIISSLNVLYISSKDL